MIKQVKSESQAITKNEYKKKIYRLDLNLEGYES